MGGGQAGFSLAAKLRALGHAGPIAIVGEEPHMPYQRPPLSKAFLLGDLERDRLVFRPGDFFEKQNIELVLGSPARELDPKARKIALTDGRELAYDVAVLATGAEPRRLPEAMGGSLAGLYYLRTIADAEALAPALQPGRHAVVIGGGYIGLEAAASAHKHGLTVTLVEATERILQRVAAPETSNYFRRLHSQKGVQLLEGVGVSALIGSGGRLVAVGLSNGAEIPADLAIVGIGVSPRTELAASAGLAVENGVMVDEFCRTSDERIFAVGDCASFPHRGMRLRLESVGHAIDHAERAAEIIMGGDTPYRAKPWFWSDQFHCKLQIAGLNHGYDGVFVRPGTHNESVSHWYFRGEELLAVDAMNEPKAFMLGKRMLEAGRLPKPEQVVDPQMDLKALLG